MTGRPMLTKIKAFLGSILPDNAYARAVSLLAGGTAIAQTITILASPILTRIYDPEDFGLYSVYAGILGIITVAASLRYELAIPLEEKDEEAAHVVILSLAILVGVSLLSMLVVILWKEPITDAFGVPLLARYLWLVPIGVLLGGAYNIFYYWSIREKSFSQIASTKLRQAVVTVTTQLAAFQAGVITLLIAQILGQSAGAVSLAKPALRQGVFNQVSWPALKKMAAKHSKFPLYSLAGCLANSANTQIPIFVFSAIYSPAAAGVYFLAFRVLSLPASVIGNAISEVFFSKAPEYNRRGKISVLLTKNFNILTHLALPPVVLLVVIGPELFEWVFGKEWRQAGMYARWMAPWLYFQFIASPLSILLSVLGEQKKAMLWQFMMLFITTLMIILGVSKGGSMALMKFLSAGNVISYTILLLIVFSSARVKYKDVLKPVVKSLLLAMTYSAPLIICRLFNCTDGMVIGAAIFNLILILIGIYKMYRGKEFLVE